ncbi:hypothetical protein LptCag_2660 [Leptospirillum ferriphilum]|uniref:Uncharacterized protein n=1 Tax=Leptospirillum ferriphilum TaxID=178606 RepID=A0A094YPP2_9BACT|nr:hypothetical protein LptCag_2660 [Leptospirillum ferriphilum]
MRQASVSERMRRISSMRPFLKGDQIFEGFPGSVFPVQF